jgi:ADP-heptose:LPS heptosyltransferase
MSTHDKWVGVARMGGIGDNIIASSVLPGLKKKFGMVEVITSKPCHVVFENNPYIDKLSVREKGDPDWGDGHSWQAWFNSISKNFEAFYHLSHSCETLGALIKVQTAFWWPEKMRRKMCGKNYLEIVHDICDIPYEEIAPNFFPTDEENQKAIETKANVGRKAIGWVLSGSRLDKVHPHADIMIAKIIKELGVPVIMFGAPGKDFENAKLIEKEVNKINRTKDGLHLALSPDMEKQTWNIRRLLTQVQHCDLVIGPDTGPMWGVAMHEMPKVMLHSHASPENITKYWKNTISLHADQNRVTCWPCHRLHDDASTCKPNEDKNGAACITDITVDVVLENVVQLLKEK